MLKQKTNPVDEVLHALRQAGDFNSHKGRIHHAQRVLRKVDIQVAVDAEVRSHVAIAEPEGELAEH